MLRSMRAFLTKRSTRVRDWGLCVLAGVFVTDGVFFLLQGQIVVGVVALLIGETCAWFYWTVPNEDDRDSP
jgi:hypothetical protein